MPGESMISQEQLKNQHPGLYKCPAFLVSDLMPDLEPVMRSAPVDLWDYTADVKVHMLMPGMWPCIPNWHCDLVPRDKNNQQDFTRASAKNRLHLWLSGHPLTEFRSKLFGVRRIQPQKWVCFSQLDEHRGTQAKEHIWRLFIRLAPKSIYPANPLHKVLRRHSQVYLDSDFVW